MNFNIDNHTGILIKKAARLFEQVANKGLDELGVTYVQTTFLIRLWQQDGQTQTELAYSSGLKQPTVVRLLDRMERDGLITRKRDAQDRRVFNFYLTAKAKRACLKLESHVDRMNRVANVAIPHKDVAQFNRIIKQLIGNLQQFLDNKT